MTDRVTEAFDKIVSAFAEMRIEMRRNQKHSGKIAATDKLYEAIRQFAPEIGLLPPIIPIENDEEYLRVRD